MATLLELLRPIFHNLWLFLPDILKLLGLNHDLFQHQWLYLSVVDEALTGWMGTAQGSHAGNNHNEHAPLSIMRSNTPDLNLLEATVALVQVLLNVPLEYLLPRRVLLYKLGWVLITVQG